MSHSRFLFTSVHRPAVAKEIGSLRHLSTLSYLRNNLPPHINQFEIDAEIVLRVIFEDIAASNKPEVAPFKSPAKAQATVPDTEHAGAVSMQLSLAPQAGDSAVPPAATGVIAAPGLPPPTRTRSPLRALCKCAFAFSPRRRFCPPLVSSPTWGFRHQASPVRCIISRQVTTSFSTLNMPIKLQILAKVSFKLHPNTSPHFNKIISNSTGNLSNFTQN